MAEYFTPTILAMIGRIFSHLFSFRGRSGRLEYFLHSISELFVILGFIFLLVSLEEMGIESSADIVGFLLLGALLLSVISEIAVTARRLHDLDQSGWMILAGLIPIYNIIQGFQLLFSPGTPFNNRYGPPPKELAEQKKAAHLEKRENRAAARYKSPYQDS